MIRIAQIFILLLSTCNSSAQKVKPSILNSLIDINITTLQEFIDTSSDEVVNTDTIQYGIVEHYNIDSTIILCTHMYDANQVIRYYIIQPKGNVITDDSLIINSSKLIEVEETLGKKSFQSIPRIYGDNGYTYGFKNINDEWILSSVSIHHADGANYTDGFKLDTILLGIFFDELEDKIDSGNYLLFDNLIDINLIISNTFKDVKYPYNSMDRIIGYGFYQNRIEFKHLIFNKSYANFIYSYDDKGKVIPSYISLQFDNYLFDKVYLGERKDYVSTNEMLAVGFCCLAPNKPSRDVMAMVNLINENNIEVISEWTNSLNLEKRVLGSIGVKFFIFKNKSTSIFSKIVLNRVEETLSNGYFISSCYGCSYDNPERKIAVNSVDLYSEYQRLQNIGLLLE